MANPPLPHWHVEASQVHEETTLGPGNTGLVTQWVVPYTIDSGPAKGSTHEVRVLPRDFNPSHVAQVIADALANVHAIASLGHPGA